MKHYGDITKINGAEVPRCRRWTASHLAALVKIFLWPAKGRGWQGSAAVCLWKLSEL